MYHLRMFLMYFEFLNLYFGNQICRYFGNFSRHFRNLICILYLGFSFILNCTYVLQQKSLRTTDLIVQKSTKFMRYCRLYRERVFYEICLVYFQNLVILTKQVLSVCTVDEIQRECIFLKSLFFMGFKMTVQKPKYILIMRNM